MFYQTRIKINQNGFEFESIINDQIILLGSIKCNTNITYQTHTYSVSIHYAGEYLKQYIMHNLYNELVHILKSMVLEKKIIFENVMMNKEMPSFVKDLLFFNLQRYNKFLKFSKSFKTKKDDVENFIISKYTEGYYLNNYQSLIIKLRDGLQLVFARNISNSKNIVVLKTLMDDIYLLDDNFMATKIMISEYSDKVDILKYIRGCIYKTKGLKDISHYIDEEQIVDLISLYKRNIKKSELNKRWNSLPIKDRDLKIEVMMKY